ncbi:MAG: tRNA (guanosine(46)-N7)-methyltransferase TrmB [Minwuia sp.]|uniref:tRNA (guanosine(46)-N7)-methyltransferase TrmB n=1 Tax=Minwuia sp. TaxID=2493630 RepID=UPI003A874FD4
MPARSDTDRPAGPPFRFYGRRRGKRPSRRQEELLESLLPQLGPDPARLPEGTLWLEIGAGGGEHLCAQAAKNPDVTLIGCEPFLEGVAKTLATVEEQELGNVRLHAEDARPFLEALPEASIERCFLLFPDPWPKLRHHKRRFVNPANLDRLARVIRPGGQFRIATDHMDYARWILPRMLAHPAFEWTAERADDWRCPPADHVTTRYQQKAEEKGDWPLFFDFLRGA